MNGEHSLKDFLKNENIKSDRFAYAAISYIFKAFGDNKRSKEFWPWGKSVNFSWNNGNDSVDGSIVKDIVNNKSWNILGPKSNLTRALLCIAEAHNRGFEDDEEEIINDTDNSIKGFRKRLANSIYNVKKSDKVNNKINETSKNTINQIEELETHE